jgi:hypothetical protein
MHRLILAATLAVGPQTQIQSAARVAWTIPPGWRAEIIPFPLDFAPTIQHKGIEELRFAPGAFKAGTPDFWSYAFVWKLEESKSLDIPQLEEELTAYYKGLCLAVGKGKYTFHESRFKVRLQWQGKSLIGQIESYDPFATGKAITLRVVIHQRLCAKGIRLVFAVSPKPESDPIWTTLNQLQSDFTCE